MTGPAGDAPDPDGIGPQAAARAGSLDGRAIGDREVQDFAQWLLTASLAPRSAADATEFSSVDVTCDPNEAPGACMIRIGRTALWSEPAGPAGATDWTVVCDLSVADPRSAADVLRSLLAAARDGATDTAGGPEGDRRGRVTAAHVSTGPMSGSARRRALARSRHRPANA